jgi:hypothetical protein
MEAEARMRANWAKFSISCIKRFDHPERDSLLAAIHPRTRQAIREAGPLAWIDADVFLDLAATVREVLGPRDAARYWRTNLRESMDQPFVRPLSEGSMLLFGRTPGALVRRTPHSWKLVSRGCGRWEVETDDDARRATVDQYDLPLSFRSHAGWASVLEGGLGALIDTAGARGEVTVDTGDYAYGHLSALMAWR